MPNNEFTTSALILSQILPDVSIIFERILISEQLRSLGIEFSLAQTKNGMTLNIPTSGNGQLHITATNKTTNHHNKFFSNLQSVQIRFPNGKVFKSKAEEFINATVKFESPENQHEITYLLIEPNFAEVIDTAIEALAQIDAIYVTPIKKNCISRGKKTSQPSLDQ